MSPLVLASAPAPRRRRYRPVLAALLALSAAACGREPTAPRAVPAPRLDTTAPPDTAHRLGNYENPAV